jgi:hypothetical protein
MLARMRRMLAVGIVGLVLCGTASADDASLNKRFSTMLMLTAWADRDARQCTDADCTFWIQNAQTRALIGMGFMRKEPPAYLSAAGRAAEQNAMKAFYAYFRAEAAFLTGDYSGYMNQLKEAITQANAANTRLGRSQAWFALVMISAGCPNWQTAIRAYGIDPCG